MAETVPLFPLRVVLLPGMPLPMHIFEQRYQQLIADITGDQSPGSFGVVTLHRGGETDRDWNIDGNIDRDIAEVGTMAEIIEREPYPDGRIDLLTVGTRRFRVLSVERATRPYLTADIEWLPEDFGAINAPLLGGARQACRDYLAKLSSMGMQTEDDLSQDPLKLSYEIAIRLQIPLNERLQLLCSSTVADRLRAERQLLGRELALLEATRAIPVPSWAVQSVFGGR